MADPHCSPLLSCPLLFSSPLRSSPLLSTGWLSAKEDEPTRARTNNRALGHRCRSLARSPLGSARAVADAAPPLSSVQGARTLLHAPDGQENNRVQGWGVGGAPAHEAGYPVSAETLSCTPAGRERATERQRRDGEEWEGCVCDVCACVCV